MIHTDNNKNQVFVVEIVMAKMINQTSCFVVLNIKGYSCMYYKIIAFALFAFQIFNVALSRHLFLSELTKTFYVSKYKY